ncbi:MAG: RHS repeat-associated core domain-containing protein [Sulfuriferula sp.]
MYQYRARYYDPTIGRFISEDPKGFAGVRECFSGLCSRGEASMRFLIRSRLPLRP